MTIDPVTGRIAWTPSQAQPPATYTVTVRVTNTNNPPLSDTKTFTVTVTRHTPPVIAAFAVSGTNVTLSGTNGIPGWTYHVLASTNVALPLTSWTRIGTNVFYLNEAFAFTNRFSPLCDRQFYSLQIP
jgi:hypothetical protein